MDQPPPFFQNLREVCRFYTARVLCLPFWWASDAGAAADAVGVRLLTWGERSSRPRRTRGKS